MRIRARAGYVALRLAFGLPVVAGVALATPAATLAHTLTDQYQAPLPIVVYIAGAALAVAMSFVFVMLRSSTQAGEPAALMIALTSFDAMVAGPDSAHPGRKLRRTR